MSEAVSAGKLVRIELVRFHGGEGPMSGYQLVDDGSGNPVGAGLFRDPDLARAYANQRAWTVVVEPTRRTA